MAVHPLYGTLPLPKPRHKIATPALADAIARVESDFGKHMRSHDGDRIGWHMIGKTAWSDVSKWRRDRGFTTFPHSAAFTYNTSTFYCIEYLNMLEERLRAVLARDPTLEEVLCAYRKGFTTFKRAGFSQSGYRRYLNAVKANLK